MFFLFDTRINQILYKRLGMAQSMKTLKLGLGDGKRQVLQALPVGQAFVPSGLERPHVPTGQLPWECTPARLSDLISQRMVEMQISWFISIRNLIFSEPQLWISEVRSQDPRYPPHPRGVGMAKRGFEGGCQGCLSWSGLDTAVCAVLTISWSHTLGICTKHWSELNCATMNLDAFDFSNRNHLARFLVWPGPGSAPSPSPSYQCQLLSTLSPLGLNALLPEPCSLSHDLRSSCDLSCLA